MTQRDADDRIELPEPPLRTTSDEGPLQGAEVVAHLLAGNKLRGKLTMLSVARQLISLQQAHLPVGTDIHFADIRHLIFTRHSPIAPDDQPLPPALNNSESIQNFRVSFGDGKTLTGKTRGHFVDEAGLHFFLVVENSVVRLFIPHLNIKEYHIGPLIGEALVHDKPALKKDVDAALEKQSALRGKKLGEYLLDHHAVTPEQLKKVLDQQHVGFQLNKRPHSSLLGQLLLDFGWITTEQLRDALAEQQKDHSKKLGELLIESGAIDTQHFYIALSRALGVPFVELGKFEPEESALACIPGDIARKYHLLPLCLYRDRLVVAVTDPTATEAIDVAQFIAGHSLELAIATHEDIENAIASSYPEGETLEEDALAAEENQISTVVEEHRELKRAEIEQLGSNKPIVRLVNRILLDAIRRRASDIHLRPLEEKVDLLFRIDGSLVSIRHLSKGLLLPIVSRIKIIGSMDIAEHRVPQDGRARITDGKAIVDLRISVMPTVNGESVVIRLLNTASGLKQISQLGFNERDGGLFTDLLHKSYGMILVTGPTGSGKSTTLYAALQEVIEQNVNIITVEDPVEYHIDGIEQIQVNTAQGYTFARALRNILRHDPDVIMIGEIRDQETGQIAIESALTGHLVLSTLHTNDSAGAVTRLLEMGIPSFLLNAALLGVLAQRLVRRNCEHCLQEESPDPAVRKLLGVPDDEVFYKGVGCEHCNHTGYSGRLAVYELLKVTTAIRTMINEGASAESLHEVAVQEGMVPLTENALGQARQHATSLMEVYRVRLE